MPLIERAKALEDLQWLAKKLRGPLKAEAYSRINKLCSIPEADAVPVTRCKDCRFCTHPYWSPYNSWCSLLREYTSPHGFCHRAEPGDFKEDIGSQAYITAKTPPPFPLHGLTPKKITIGERLYSRLMCIEKLHIIVKSIGGHTASGEMFGIPFEVDYFVDPDLFRIDYWEAK